MKISKVRAQFKSVLLLLALLLGFGIQPALVKPMQMHIMEGFSPAGWCIFWSAIDLPFWVIGFLQIKKRVIEKPKSRLLLGLAGVFTLVLSTQKVHSVIGSSSQPTGTGFGAILFGPFPISIFGSVVLLFQALFLAPVAFAGRTVAPSWAC